MYFNRAYYRKAMNPYYSFSRPELPAINTNQFSQSVQQFEYLIQQSQLLLNRLEDKTFAYHLMDAAQKSDKATVDQLIKSISGLSVVANINYSPTGVVFQLQSPAVGDGADCCSLSIVLKWS